MMGRGSLILAGCCAGVLIPSAAAAAPSCGDIDEIERLLQGSYGEVPMSSGLQDDGALLRIFASPVNGSWTAVTVTPQGLSCLVATGQHWGPDATVTSPAGPPALILSR